MNPNSSVNPLMFPLKSKSTKTKDRNYSAAFDTYSFASRKGDMILRDIGAFTQSFCPVMNEINKNGSRQGKKMGTHCNQGS